jgi:hypothetical protein
VDHQEENGRRSKGPPQVSSCPEIRRDRKRFAFGSTPARRARQRREVPRNEPPNVGVAAGGLLRPAADA